MISKELAGFLSTKTSFVDDNGISIQVRELFKKELEDIKTVASSIQASRFGSASGSITASTINQYIDQKIAEIDHA